MKCRSNNLDPRIIGGLRAVIMPNDVLDEKQVTHYPLPLHGMVGYAVECLMGLQNLGTNPRDRLFYLTEVNYGSPFPFRCRFDTAKYDRFMRIVGRRFPHKLPTPDMVLCGASDFY